MPYVKKSCLSFCEKDFRDIEQKSYQVRFTEIVYESLAMLQREVIKLPPLCLLMLKFSWNNLAILVYLTRCVLFMKCMLIYLP